MAERNMKAIEDLKRKLSKPEAIMDLVATSLAEESLGLIKDGHRTETDPYGQKWAPKKRPDGRKVLSGKTSRLKTGWHIKRVTRDGILIAPSVDYAVYHQDPLPRRRLTSEESRQRSLDRGFTREQIDRSRSFDESFVGPAQLTRQRRMMVPDELLGLPPKWEEALNETANDALATIIGGDGRRVAGLRKRLGISSIVGFKVG